MSDKVCDIDTSELDNLLDKLSEENRRKMLFKSLIKGGQTLIKDTEQELLRVLPNASRGDKLGKPMTQGIKLKKDKDYSEVMVHIMGDFRLKFFEMGTDERYLKKPLPQKETTKYKHKSGSVNTGGKPYRGKIKAKHFFERARENTNIQTTIVEQLTKEFDKLIK